MRIESSGTSPKMDPAIWSRLPEELLVLVLSLLPLRELFNLRSTCKLFSSLVFSPSFLCKHSSSSSTPFSSFLLLSHPQCFRSYPLYDTTLGMWRSLALSHSVTRPGSAPPTLLAASNGLFCFAPPNSSSFLVCNVLARSHRVIEFPTRPFAFEMLTLLSTPLGYKIFVLCCSRSSSNRAFVYDSRRRCWNEFGCAEPLIGESCLQEGALRHGFLYLTTPEPFSVVRFDLDSGKWERPEAELPGELTFARLVGDGGGKLYLVGGIGRNGISRSMKLWELGEDEGNWNEVGALPELICRKFMSVCYHNYEHVYCFWHQGIVCVCCYTWPEILYYKVSRGTWHWLPKCPSLSEKWVCGFRWFSFVPDLYALA